VAILPELVLSLISETKQDGRMEDGTVHTCSQPATVSLLRQYTGNLPEVSLPSMPLYPWLVMAIYITLTEQRRMEGCLEARA
jgi:hypothetical protein